jgi:hypothetical protein
MARRKAGKGRRSGLTLHGWDLVIEATVIVTSTVIAALILVWIGVGH